MTRRVLFGRRVVPALTKCRGCGAPVVWRRTEAGRFQPVNADGTVHFSTCPDAAAFRRLSRRRASAAAARGIAAQQRLPGVDGACWSG